MKNPFGRLFGRKSDTEPMRAIDALVEGLAVSAVHVVSDETPSLSHFGGTPNLPGDASWPERNGKRLGFLARLSLTEIQRAHPFPWLPTYGALLFFYDIEEQPWGFDPRDRGGWAVLHVPDLPGPFGSPETASEDVTVSIPRRSISFRRIDVLPSYERDQVEALELNDREGDEYIRIADSRFEDLPRHQVGGFPSPVQGDGMELECQLVSNDIYCGDVDGYKDVRVPALEPGAANWRLLFQFDTDDDLDVMWGDCGRLYFWVEEQEARAGNFSKTWLVLQCS